MEGQGKRREGLGKGGGKVGERGEGEERRGRKWENGTGPDQVREEIDVPGCFSINGAPCPVGSLARRLLLATGSVKPIQQCTRAAAAAA